ncbi:hypothetical protein IMCC14465_12720 [alpha proteobacterium IMCC14465]|uniref:Uncharacterized protein n=1 Tax=alpha proteobacterium IMCC14465 TaxID=1220535 RepID=J9DHU4_9PROT|nr:hypothetical protein IMCC14465_12720 [alpha proteobacterium IMCC14465]
MRLVIRVGTLNFVSFSLVLMSLVSLCLVVLSLSVTQVSAAGRTYKSPKDEEKPEYELCRLKELLREEEGNSCVYSRQTGGRDVVIKIDESVICQAEFRCKKE